MGKWFLYGYKVFFSGEEKMLKFERDVSYITLKVSNATELHLLKQLIVCYMNYTSIKIK